jgi:hypothetical protein
VQKYISDYIPAYESFTIPTECLKLAGVKQFKIQLPQKDKMKFVYEFYQQLPGAMTMVFVNMK